MRSGAAVMKTSVAHSFSIACFTPADANLSESAIASMRAVCGAAKDRRFAQRIPYGFAFLPSFAEVWV